jgi:GH25 family lysozyme M1 (1,4-beta-N-acetylmuramidase)
VPPPKFIPTPVHPEKITHPGADSMQAVTAAHGKWRHSVRMRPAITVMQLPGIDISAYQGNISWGSVSPYIDFSYAKASEGTYYTNPDFYNQYEGPYNSGTIRGAYHFAIPDNSSGQSQARYFIHHGGGWSSDGRTLPGALDIEYNPYGSECYGLTHSQMKSWIEDFVMEYAYKEHVYPVIYTTTDWWTTCTGNASRFGQWDPLWIANYGASGGGPLPRGWGFYTFWQYSDAGNMPGDQDVFNGDHNRLRAFAAKG